MSFTVVLAAVGVVGLLYLGYRVFVQGKQLYGVERSREADWDAGRQSTLDLAELQGWPVEEHPARAWPGDLASARPDGRSCLLAVRGPDFEASTWSAKERLAGAAAGRAEPDLAAAARRTGGARRALRPPLDGR